jgi:hypothetical protein
MNTSMCIDLHLYLLCSPLLCSMRPIHERYGQMELKTRYPRLASTRLDSHHVVILHLHASGIFPLLAVYMCDSKKMRTDFSTLRGQLGTVLIRPVRKTNPSMNVLEMYVCVCMFVCASGLTHAQSWPVRTHTRCHSKRRQVKMPTPSFAGSPRFIFTALAPDGRWLAGHCHCPATHLPEGMVATRPPSSRSLCVPS